MITCFLRYEIDPDKIDDFEHYGRLWITLVERFGGKHHGYLLPAEGESDIAYASFTFDSLASYEDYRTRSFDDADCRAAFDFARRTGCIRRYERSFLRPVTEGIEP
ncbi:MAG: NIPSNAP family protein [Roseitalea porphyridii]|jgi:hypothetical protein|uniref:NIPSNAP family protein n=1 Tax=Roseitalea porphyridii TaxID=1852022 RepID=UPI0032EBF668